MLPLEREEKWTNRSAARPSGSHSQKVLAARDALFVRHQLEGFVLISFAVAKIVLFLGRSFQCSQDGGFFHCGLSSKTQDRKVGDIRRAI